MATDAATDVLDALQQLLEYANETRDSLRGIAENMDSYAKLIRTMANSLSNTMIPVGILLTELREVTSNGD
jgi:hypothetical protein